MNRRRTLTLIEITVMLLVFALAAALCMVSFARIENGVRENTCRDRAIVEMQNAGEVLRHCGGDFAAAADRHGGIWDRGDLGRTAVVAGFWGVSNLCETGKHRGAPPGGRTAGGDL